MSFFNITLCKCANPVSDPNEIKISYERALDIANSINGCNCVQRYIDLNPDNKDKIFDYSQCLSYEHECPESKCSHCKKTSPVQKPDNSIKLYCPFCGKTE